MTFVVWCSRWGCKVNVYSWAHQMSDISKDNSVIIIKVVLFCMHPLYTLWTYFYQRLVLESSVHSHTSSTGYTITSLLRIGLIMYDIQYWYRIAMVPSTGEIWCWTINQFMYCKHCCVLWHISIIPPSICDKVVPAAANLVFTKPLVTYIVSFVKHCAQRYGDGRLDLLLITLPSCCTKIRFVCMCVGANALYLCAYMPWRMRLCACKCVLLKIRSYMPRVNC